MTNNSDLSKVVDTVAEGFYKIGMEAKDISKELDHLRISISELVGVSPEILYADYVIDPDDVFSFQRKRRRRRSKCHYAISSRSMKG